MKLRKASAAILMVWIASFLMTGNVLAHAILVRSFPAANSELTQPPAKLELWFSEPVEGGFSSARLLDTFGDEIPVGTAKLDPNDATHLTVPLSQLSAGIYTVAWVSLSSDDGHEESGSFPFTILNSDGSRPSQLSAVPAPDLETNTGFPTFAQTISRWLTLMGGVLFVSVPLFFIFIIPNLDEDSDLGIRFHALGIMLVGLGVLAIFVGSWLQFILQSIQLENLNLIPKLIAGTHTGSLALARMSFALGGLLIILKLHQSSARYNWIFIVGVIFEICILFLTVVSGFHGEWLLSIFTFVIVGDLWGMAWYINRTSDSFRQSWILLCAFGFVTLLLFSLGSHADSVPGKVWAVANDFIHLLAASAWMGGLILLPVMLGQLRRVSQLDQSVLGPLFRRYGNVAKFSFFVLLTTGLFNGLVQFPTLTSLVNTVYGQVLLIKLLLMVVVWWISLRSSNALRRQGLSGGLWRFNRQIALAALTGLFLMAAVAALVQTRPPIKSATISPSASLPFISHLQSGDLTIHVQVTPSQVGDNYFKVFLSHEDGSSIGDVQWVRLLFNYQNAEIGQSSIDLNQQAANVFGIEGTYLNQPGTWKLSISVRRRGMDDTVSDIGLLNLSTPALQNASPFQNPVTNTPAGELLAGTMMIFGFELYRWRRTFKQTKPKIFPAVMLIAPTLFLAGLIILFYAVSQSRIIFLPGS